MNRFIIVTLVYIVALFVLNSIGLATLGLIGYLIGRYIDPFDRCPKFKKIL